MVKPDVAGRMRDALPALQAAFQPLAVQYRQRKRVIELAGWIGTALLLGAGCLDGFDSMLFVGGCACLLLLSVILSQVLPILACPACAKHLDGNLGAYCPECGEHAVAPESWFAPPSCRSCHCYLCLDERGRHYRIRACTHCGAKVDDEGL